MPPKKYKTEAERKEAKRRSTRESVRKKRGTEKYLTKKQKRFAELFPISKSGTQAAIDAGYKPDNAGVIACLNLKKDNVIAQIAKEEKNLKQAFKDRGLDEDYLAERFKDVIDYNSKKIKKFYGEGDNLKEVEEMRDAKVVAKALVDVAKLAGSSLENVSNSATVNVDSSTAWLAIKSLVKKLEKEQIRLLRDSCDALLSDDCEVVS
jgi:phage terminase small subunit